MDRPRHENPWLARRPFHWAHQGGAREAPSNTLYAMEAGRANGAHGLEFDVHCSRDGRVVLIHDKTLHRTTDRSGWVAQHSAEELAKCDAAYWWVDGQVDNHEPGTPEPDYRLRGRIDKDPDLGIPDLGDVLQRFADMPMTIEVKDARAVDRLVELLDGQGVSKDEVIVTSFDDEIVERLHARAPELPLAPGKRHMIRLLIRARLWRRFPDRGPYVALQVPHRYPWKEMVPARFAGLVPEGWKFTFLTPRFVRAAHRAGMAVHVWTIDDEAEMHELLDMDVDGIMTDSPSVLSRVLASRGTGA